MSLILHLWDKLWATVFPPTGTKPVVIFHPCTHGEADE